RLAAGNQVVVLALDGERRAGGRGWLRRSWAVAFDRGGCLVLAGGVFDGGGGGGIGRGLVADRLGGRSSDRRGRRSSGRSGLGRLAGSQQQRKGGRGQGEACGGAEIQRWIPGSWWTKRTAAAVRPAGSARNCAFHRDQRVGDAQGVLQRRALYAVLAIDDEGRRGANPATHHEVPRRTHRRVSGRRRQRPAHQA